MNIFFPNYNLFQYKIKYLDKMIDTSDKILNDTQNNATFCFVIDYIN